MEYAATGTHGLQSKWLYSSVAVTPSPVWGPTQWRLVLSCRLRKNFSPAFVKEMDKKKLANVQDVWNFCCLQGDLKQFLLATRGNSGKDSSTSRNAGKSPPRPPQLSVTQIIQLASQIAQGMEHLSNQRFVHRDLAARNCLIASNLTVKVSLSALSKDTYNKEYCKYHNQVHSYIDMSYLFLLIVWDK